MYIWSGNIIQFNGDNMLEYAHNCLKVYGFEKILFLDEHELKFKYKRKELLISGQNLKIVNLLDKSLEIFGIIDNISIKYTGV